MIGNDTMALADGSEKARAKVGVWPGRKSALMQRQKGQEPHDGGGLQIVQEGGFRVLFRQSVKHVQTD
jgi:hypothetical protein